jgi:hypothetical protein
MGWAGHGLDWQWQWIASRWLALRWAGLVVSWSGLGGSGLGLGYTLGRLAVGLFGIWDVFKLAALEVGWASLQFCWP